jgi:hypothetical protein
MHPDARNQSSRWVGLAESAAAGHGLSQLYSRRDRAVFGMSNAHGGGQHPMRRLHPAKGLMRSKDKEYRQRDHRPSYTHENPVWHRISRHEFASPTARKPVFHSDLIGLSPTHHAAEVKIIGPRDSHQRGTARDCRFPPRSFPHYPNLAFIGG